jgi:hypothetical protein
MMIIDNEFDIKQVVYLKTDIEQKPRIVTGLLVSETSIVYELSCSDGVCNSFHFEISNVKDILISSLHN